MLEMMVHPYSAASQQVVLIEPSSTSPSRVDSFCNHHPSNPPFSSQPGSKQSASHRRRKRVTFKTNRGDRVEASARITSIEAPFEDIWMSQDDVQKIFTECRNIVTSPLRKEIRESIRLIMQSHRSGSDDITHHIKIVVASPARGLEHRVEPLVRSYRQRHLRSVLAFQKELRSKGADAETLAKMLRMRSLQASRCGRQLALKLAHGDTIEARNVYAAGSKQLANSSSP